MKQPLALILAGTLAACAAEPVSAPPAPSISADEAARLSAWIETTMAERNIPKAAATVACTARRATTRSL